MHNIEGTDIDSKQATIQITGKIFHTYLSYFLHCCGLEMIDALFYENIEALNECFITIKCKSNGKGYDDIIQDMYDREAVIERLKKENEELKEELEITKSQFEEVKDSNNE